MIEVDNSELSGHCFLNREEEAVSLLTQVAASDYWPSFAACAAEADLLRLRESSEEMTRGRL